MPLKQPSTVSNLPQRTSVLAKAVLRVADRLALSQKDLGDITGFSAATISRLRAGVVPAFDPKRWQVCALLVRIFRSADALFGGNDEMTRRWFHSHNHHLQGTPALLVCNVEGLVNVARYLDFMRGSV